jgi:tetratricopeptide (TPR) repeat protein
MGQDHEALRYYDQALPLWRGDVQLAGEALTLTYMAKSYTNLGEKQRAIESFHQAIDRWLRR